MREEVITPQTEYEKAIKLLEELIQRDLEEQKEDIQKLWELLKELEFIQDKSKLLPHTKYVKEVALFLLRRTAKTEYEDVFWRAMLLETPFKFESYIYYLEKDRPIEKQFYRPRQMTLKTVVDDLQDLYDDKLDFLGISLPPRIGKSTTGLLFLTWNALVNPNSHSALGGHSGRLTKGFYKELLNFFTEKEYTFNEMYSYLHPNHELIQDKSAEDMTITMDEPDRFATLTCRGIDATWTGDIDVSKDGYLYVDDLVRDRQHSLSPSRMENTYQEYQNKMLDRVNDGGKVIMIGTLWNVSDPLERERKLNDGNPRARFRKIPALNEMGESNFQYKVKGFSTKYYLDMKARLDKAEWEAKYQQQPFVREGLLFEADQMEYFDGVLPEGEYTPVAVVDVAFGGGDRLSMPIGMLNKETRVCYIVDWLFNKGDKNVTKPLIINKIRTHEIPEIQFEKNSGGELYKDEIQEDLRNEKITCLLKSKSAPNNMSKEQKIQYYAPNIMKFVFLTPNRPTAEQKALDTANGTKRYARNNDYDLAMDETLMFVTEGKNLHDDAPDSLSQLAMYLDTKANKKATIISSPF